MDYIRISTQELVKWLKENLNEKRYNHSIGTAEYAQKLAKRFNQDEKKAYIAGLLHDCAKCFPDEKLIEMIKKNNLDVQDIEMMSTKTLHAPVSAYIAQHEFGVVDEEILSSIRWHTLGKINMSDFEKIIFIADKVEIKTRDKAYLELVRKYLEEDDGLNKALLKCYKETIKSLVERNLKICPMTIDIYNRLEDVTNVN